MGWLLALGIGLSVIGFVAWNLPMMVIGVFICIAVHGPWLESISKRRGPWDGD